ncbi:hypothetical protein M8Z33_41830 [Streptomyces sp. ZAF1911]|uniref:hypothetical protein n=1 Tax=Streptomyces sp. ZAF1911 TaxID=2944129 RepID=UPI00237B558B|nr:hypothetical protein [Streptomyces sp. ZAF1911]MDD9383078.1 hypothetical protein [Streptomyces sp. ZAF1911]
MSGRQRRVGYGTLAGVLVQGCAGWVLWSGYTDAGLLLSLLAGAVVLASVWRSGALDRTPPAAPAPEDVRRRAASPRQKADQERSMRLLKAIDEASDAAPGEVTEFERIVLYGVAELPDREYPPPGHGYPRA